MHENTENKILKNYINNFISKYLDLLIIVLLGCIPLLWYTKDCLIAGGDFSNLLNSINSSSHYLFPWTNTALGDFGIVSCTSLSYYIFFFILDGLGLNPVLVQKIWMIFFFMLSGVCMRYFIRTIASDINKKYVVMSIISSAFYMINFYVINVRPSLLCVNGIYACTPLIMAFIYKMLVVRKKQFRYAILTSLSTLLLISGAVNPPVMAVFLFIQILFIFYLLFFSNNPIEFIKSIKYILLCIFISILINLWWLIPFYKLLFCYKAYAVYMPVYWNPGSFIKDTFVLAGSWAWGDGYYPISYPVYQNIFVKYTMYLIPCIVFSVLLIKNNKFKKISYFFLIVSFIGILLSKGRGGVSGNIFVYLFDNFPLFWMFREPYSKFSVLTVLGYSVLLGVCVQSVFDKVIKYNKRLSIYVPFVVLLIVFFAGWPIFTKYFIDQTDRGFISSFVKVPKYWDESASYMNNKNDNFRLLEMPENKSAYTMLGWDNGFSGASPDRSFFKKPVITSSLYSPNIIQYYYYMFRDYNYGVARRLFKLFNVKYVFQRNDFMWTIFGSWHPKKARLFLQNKLGLQKEKSFGLVDFYNTGINAENVYLKDSIDIIVGGFNALQLLSYTKYMDNPSISFWGIKQELKNEKLYKYSKRIIFSEGSDKWIMRLLPELCKFNPEKKLGWKDHDYKIGWSLRNNFYGGEWLEEEDQKFINGDFFENNGAIFTTGEAPFNFEWSINNKDDYYIGMKYYVSGFDDKVILKVNSEDIGYNKLTQSLPSMRWVVKKKSLSPGKHKISILNKGKSATVDSVVFFTDRDIKKAHKKAEEIVKDKDKLFLFSLNNKDSFDKKFRIIEDEQFRISVCASNIDVSDEQRIKFYIDDKQFEGTIEKEKLTEIDTVKLTKGIHSIRAGEGCNNVIVKIFIENKENTQYYKNISEKKYGPSRLVIEHFEIDKPMFLIFNEKYHDGWKAYNMTNKQKFYTGFMTFMNVFIPRNNFKEIKDHVMVNGYANAFYLPKAGNYNILLEFEPQNGYDKGLFISLITGILCIIFLVVNLFRKRIIKI
ncbi:MAG: hypothetical protein P9M13_00750 [Candidatus Ancaeobacter aquaticus]|nr:hypothetical protein [Candidatus Ancaeobacter aquaticus]